MHSEESVWLLTDALGGKCLAVDRCTGVSRLSAIFERRSTTTHAHVAITHLLPRKQTIVFATNFFSYSAFYLVKRIHLILLKAVVKKKFSHGFWLWNEEVVKFRFVDGQPTDKENEACSSFWQRRSSIAKHHHILPEDFPMIFLKLWSSVCGILSERHEESKSAFDDDWYLCENKMKIWNFGSGNEFLASKSSIPAWSGFEDTNRCLQLIISPCAGWDMADWSTFRQLHSHFLLEKSICCGHFIETSINHLRISVYCWKKKEDSNGYAEFLMLVLAHEDIGCEAFTRHKSTSQMDSDNFCLPPPMHRSDNITKCFPGA